MIQSIDLGNTDVVMFNGQEVMALQLNGVMIWGANTEFIPESEASAGLMFTGLDASGKLETEEGFDGTIVGYMLGDGSENACNGLDLNVFNLASSSIIVPSVHNGLPVLRLGQFCLFPIGSPTSGPVSAGSVYFENQVIMPNLTEIKLGSNIKEFTSVENVVIGVDYSLNCRVNIPSSVEIFARAGGIVNGNFTVKSSIIYDNRSELLGDYHYDRRVGNIGCNKLIIGKNTDTVGVFYHSGSSNKVIAGFVEVEFEARTKPISLSEYSFAEQSNLTTINLPNTLSVLPLRCFNNCTALTQITIPASITSIGDVCFGGAGLTSIRFEQPNTATITLPTAGDSTGMLYVKTAKTMTIYTDNETIKNYNYAADNITATILHLDGSAWA